MNENEKLHHGFIKALSHPMRVEVLSILQEETSSPNRLARLLGKPLGNVSYHVNVLLDYDCVELVSTKPARGAVEHFYRAKEHAAFASAGLQRVPTSLRKAFAGAALSELVDRAVESMEGGAFQHQENSLFATSTMRLDEQGWQEILKILNDANARAERVGGTSGRRAVGAEGGVSVMVAIAAFELKPPRGRGDE